MTSTPSNSIPDDTYEELIQATIAALSKHGYAQVGVRDIDEEFSKSRQLINHYFDGKNDLITELLLYLIESNDGEWATSADDDPLSRLNQTVDETLLGTQTDDSRFWPVVSAMYEIQSQAHYHQEHQELINQTDARFINHISKILEDGIEQGVFNDVDTERVARIIDDLITGSHIRKICLGQDDAPVDTRESIDRFIVSQLLVDSDAE
ncbi:TetR family transcriptional regulator [Natrialba sp. PRR66]|uniref:TetR/AcrR family transcriptional regulator n=1 Tax=Natrialba sp. PRR66 TaxID=3098146 RepID=UPI002B1D202C|nr:TetR family transcriptional regulator [Natrialba sp. PRR66]